MKKSLLLFLVLASKVLMAQPYTTQDNKAIKTYEEAKQKHILTEYVEAQKLSKQAIKRDSGFVEAFYLLAGAYKATGEREEMYNTLMTCARINGAKYPRVYQLLSLEMVEFGKYEQASAFIDTMLAFRHVMNKFEAEEADMLKRKNDFCKSKIANPVPFEPRNLGPEINSQWDDYLPAITADEELIVWTVRKPAEQRVDAYANIEQEDFYFSTKKDGKWTTRQNIGPQLNTPGNEGAQTITADGRLFFFTACTRPDGLGSCDIYYSQKRGDKWTMPRNVQAPVNSRFWDSQPSCSADGRTLFFASNRMGTIGQMDLWETHVDNNGNWTNPKNLGQTINTKGDEFSPCIHPDGKTLYFSSTGHMGMGGLDIFMSRKDSSGNWGAPVNLGYPINTWRDESDLRVNAKGNMALISSDRAGGYGKNDLYEFELNPDVRPQEVTYVKGTIYDAKSMKKLQAVFELLDISTGSVIVQSFSNELTGQFLVPLPPNREYALIVAKEGYLYYSDNFNLKSDNTMTKALKLDIPMQPIEPGKKVILQNVFFDSESFILKEESKVELDKLVQFLTKNPTLKIELGGHTDNTGIAIKNISLSENRAIAVKTYLVSKGIADKRLSCKGYGDSVPIANNDSDQNKALNRRTEFMILER